MAQIYNNSFVQGLQSRPYGTQFNNTHNIPYLEPILNSNHDNYSKYDEYYFQILLFEDKKPYPKLVYGKKKDLTGKYTIKKNAYPRPGVDIDQDFIVSDESGGRKIYEYGSMLHWLLQTRKLSQLIAHTWIKPNTFSNPNNKDVLKVSKSQVKYVKKILKNPRMETSNYYVAEETVAKRIKEEKLGQDDFIGNLTEKLPGIKPYTHSRDELSSLLIKPGHVNYGCLPLALLLCGQAFYKEEGENYKQIWEPIASINQIIVELGIDVSWDTFYGVITDRSSGGSTTQYPYKQVSLPYPPQPSECSLTQEEILSWATADEKASDSYDKKEGKEYPFYPKKNSDEWKQHRTEFVNPPNPYIPLSCV